MLTFLGLVAVISVAAVLGVLTLGLGGLGFLIVYGDLVICALIIAWIVKRAIKNGWFKEGKH